MTDVTDRLIPGSPVLVNGKVMWTVCGKPVESDWEVRDARYRDELGDRPDCPECEL